MMLTSLSEEENTALRHKESAIWQRNRWFRKRRRKYVPEPDKRDLFTERMNKKGYKVDNSSGTPIVKCSSREEMENIKKDLGDMPFSFGFRFPE